MFKFTDVAASHVQAKVSKSKQVTWIYIAHYVFTSNALDV